MNDVLRPGIRTFKPRRSRISQRAELALSQQAHYLIATSDDVLALHEVWPSAPLIVLEIGSGMGEAAAAMAAADPATAIIAVDIHTPGVGNLLYLAGRHRLDNIRVVEADALHVLSRMLAPQSLSGVRSFFPDPWPKARHHKRRLVQPAVLDLVHSRLVHGGFWHIATDDASYCEQALAAFADDGRWTGGAIAQPDDRPTTGYERRAIAAGRPVVDLMFRTTN